MLTPVQLKRYAQVLWWGLQTARKQKFKSGDVVAIRFHLPALPLAEELHKFLLEKRLQPVLRLLPTAIMEKQFYDIANHKQLIFTAPGEPELAHNLNGSIFLYAPESLTHLSDIAPGKIGKSTAAQKFLRDILNAREETGDFGWTLCMFPTPELARQAQASLTAYARQVVNACFLNRREPVKQWQQVFTRARSLKKWLNAMKVKYYHIESANIDLEITPGAQRQWIGISGRNIPSFELFFSPDWRGTNGRYYADQPSFRNGNYVRGLHLEFKRGKVVHLNAKQGQAFVQSQIKLDKGADKVGEFSLTDKRFSRINMFMANTLYDENYGGRWGNCHLALGSSYSNSYRGNPADLTKEQKQKLGFNDSALHWDLVNTEKKRVSAQLISGKRITIYENGKFSI